MARGNTSSNSKYAFAKIVGLSSEDKKNDAPVLFSIKDGDDEVDAKMIEGQFEKLELGTYESKERGTKQVFNLYLYDGEQSVKLSSTWTNLGKTIINSLASQETLGKVKLELRKSKKDGKTFPNVSVYNGETKCERRLSRDEQKELIKKVMLKGKEENDDTELVEKLKSFVEEINKKAQPIVKEEIEEEKEENKPEPKDDLPFR